MVARITEHCATDALCASKSMYVDATLSLLAEIQARKCMIISYMRSRLL